MQALRLTTLLTVAAAALPLSSIAANAHAGHTAHATHAAQAPADAAAPLIDGLIRKVDKATGKVTISHGPLPDGMPAMTMVYRLKEAAWIKQFKEGKKIRYVAEPINGVLTVVRYEPVK